MHYLIIIGLLVFLIYVPQLWVKYTLRRYSEEIPDMPGTGGELAEHLLQRFELNDVSLEQTESGKDHYSPVDNAVRLGPEAYQGKSLTAIATAAHEVGHAIQFNRKEKVSLLRSRYMNKALLIQRIGAGILSVLPIVAIVVHIPHVILINVLIGVATMLVSVLMYLAVLPEEWDASFNKALPILIEGQYINDHHIPVIRKILWACALTYVAAALADILRLWRWLAILRGMR